MTGLWFSWSVFHKSTNWTFESKSDLWCLPGHSWFFKEKNQQKIRYFENAMYKMIIHTKSWQNAIFITGS